MKPHLSRVAKLGGSLGVFTLASTIDPSGGFIAKILEAVTGNLASNFIGQYDPEALLAYLDKHDPEYNHDIEKLMIDSVPKAVKLVVAKYKNENPYQDRFVDKTLKELVTYAKVKPYNQAEEHLMLTDREAWLDTIHEYIFMGGEDEEGKRTAIENFFVDNLPQCYELVFTKGLKDEKNEKPLKAFLIKTLNGLASQMETSARMQQQLLKEVKALKAEKPSRTLPVARAYFEEQFKVLNIKLDQIKEGVTRLVIKQDLLYDCMESTYTNTKRLLTQQNKAQVPIPKQLTLPPFGPEVFRGRERELAAIRKELAEGENALLLLNGQGGVGKTSLASRYYLTFQNSYTHVCWLSCERGISNAMTSLDEVLNLTFEDTLLADERLQGVIRALAELDRPGLMVLDNANDLDDLDANYKNLRRCGNFHILLTTRIDNYRQARQYSLEGLPQDEALGLFKECYPHHRKEEDELFRQLYQAVGQNTLVVEIMAKNLELLNKNKIRYQLSNLVADLQNEGVLGLSQQKEVQVDYQKFKKATPEEIVAAMYDLGELSDSEAELLSIFAVLPAEGIFFETLEVLIPDTDWLEDTLLMLAQKGWLSANENSYKCSPVVQDIVRRKKTNLLEICLPLITILDNKLNYEPGTSILINCTPSEEREFVPLAESLLAKVKGIVAELGNLCERVGSYYYHQGYLEKALIYFKKYNSIAFLLCQENAENVSITKNNLAISHSRLGDVEKARGNVEGAWAHYQEANRLMQELYRDYPTQVDYKNNLAGSHGRLGKVETARGNVEGAWAHYQEANRLMQELSRAYPTQVAFTDHLAASHSRLGEVEKARGNVEGAWAHYQEANRLMQELSKAYPTQVAYKNNLAIFHSRLGDVEEARGNVEGAWAHFQQYNRLMQELSKAYPTQVAFTDHLAGSHERLGEVEKARGNVEGAWAHYQQYNRLMQELYRDYPTQVDYKNNLAASHSRLGDVETARGNVEAAWIHYQEATRLVQELYRDYPTQVDFTNNWAISHSRLGDVEKAGGNVEGAWAHYQEANRLMQELYRDYPTQVDYKNNWAISHSRLGEVEEARGHVEAALSHYQQYNRLMQELSKAYPTQVDYKNNLAISHSRLGDVEKAGGNVEGAWAHYQEANRLMQELSKAYPTQVAYKNNLAIFHSRLGDVESALGNVEVARGHHQEATRLVQELSRAYPTQVAFTDHLAISHARLGEVEIARGNVEGAWAHYQEANRLMQELSKAYPTQVDYKNNLAASYGNLGEVEEARGNVKVACDNYLKAEQLWAELVEQIPDAAEYQEALKWVRHELDRLGCNGSSGGLNSI